jgi:hypothetical protein
MEDVETRMLRANLLKGECEFAEFGSVDALEGQLALLVEVTWALPMLV